MESHENLDQIDRDLVELEQDPNSRDLISRIFRAIHTIKGTSGFLAFGRLETLAHAGESLLSRLRDGVQPVTPETITTLLATIDGVRSLLAEIEANGNEGDVAVESIISTVHAQMNSDTSPPAAAAGPAETPVPLEEPTRPAPDPVEGQREPLGKILVESGAAQPADVGSALQQQLEG